MNIQKTHRAIQKKLGLLRRRNDNLPWEARFDFNRENLADCLGEFGFDKGVEIGTRRGIYARELCRRNPNLHLTCVDPWSSYRPRAEFRQERQDAKYAGVVERLALFNVTILRKSSVEGLSHFNDESIDFVFIDGNHEFDYVMTDIIEWSKKVKIGGIVAVHDYYHFCWSGVVQSVNAYTRAHHIDPWYTTREEHPTAIWVRRDEEPKVNNT